MFSFNISKSRNFYFSIIPTRIYNFNEVVDVGEIGKKAL